MNSEEFKKNIKNFDIDSLIDVTSTILDSLEFSPLN